MDEVGRCTFRRIMALVPLSTTVVMIRNVT